MTIIINDFYHHHHHHYLFLILSIPPSSWNAVLLPLSCLSSMFLCWSVIHQSLNHTEVLPEEEEEEEEKKTKLTLSNGLTYRGTEIERERGWHQQGCGDGGDITVSFLFFPDNVQLVKYGWTTQASLHYTQPLTPLWGLTILWHYSLFKLRQIVLPLSSKIHYLDCVKVAR